MPPIRCICGSSLAARSDGELGCGDVEWLEVSLMGGRRTDPCWCFHHLLLGAVNSRRINPHCAQGPQAVQTVADN